MATIVPPGGFAGFSQMTPASQRSLGSGLRAVRATKSRSGKRAKKRYAKNARTIGGKKRAKKSGKKAARLVKGSAAAKAYMAKIRRKRKR